MHQSSMCLSTHKTFPFYIYKTSTILGSAKYFHNKTIMYLSGYEQYTHITWYTVFTKYKIQVCLNDIFKTVFCTSGHKANINFCTDFF